MAQVVLTLDYQNNDFNEDPHQFFIEINTVVYADYFYIVVDSPDSYFDVQKGVTLFDTVTNIRSRINAVTATLGLSSKVICVQDNTKLTITVGEPSDDCFGCFIYTITNNGDSVLYPNCYSGGTYNNAILSVSTISTTQILPIENITAINSVEQITFCNSPIHLNFNQPNIKEVRVYLYIWNGLLQQELFEPNYTILKSKVSEDDNYITIEIADLIKSFLVSPPNANNTDQPVFVYNELSNPSITGQGVFWQIVADVTNNADETTRYNYNTNFATLGYRWNYEQNLIGDNGISYGGSLGFAETPNRWYGKHIHNYINQTFKLDNAVETATTANMILVNDVTPPTNYLRCSRDPYLIVYLNKLGLWDIFTPNGKVVINTKTESETGARSFRKPASIDNSFQHSKLRSNLDVTQSYTINTGSLTEDMVAMVEEIIYSPKVYLIKFKGDLNLTTTAGITIDSTYITIDDLNTTIDGLSVENEYLAYFKTHQQIPVVLTDSDFVRKTRVNDKHEINYNLKFEETNNKINDIR